MKRQITCLLAVCMLSALLCGCGRTGKQTAGTRPTAPAQTAATATEALEPKTLGDIPGINTMIRCYTDADNANFGVKYDESRPLPNGFDGIGNWYPVTNYGSLSELRLHVQRLRLRGLRLTGGIGPVGLHDRLQLALLTAELCEHRRVGIIRRIGQLALEFGIPVFNLSQLFEHSTASLVATFAQCISLPQRRKNVNRRCARAHRLSENLHFVYPRGMIACATFSSVPRSSTFTWSEPTT